MSKPTSNFLDYLISHSLNSDSMRADDAQALKLPSLHEMSKELGVSVALLREQLEVAKALGFVDVRPRTGIRRLPYSFLPAVRQSLSYAMTLDWTYFLAYADLRNHIEAAYWDEAVNKLIAEDLELLNSLLNQAWEKLKGHPIHIPHQEHRLLHLTIFRRLDNPFVLGLLEAYWEAYEAVGLNLFADYDYLNQVWEYHQQMVEAICQNDFRKGYEALVQHRDLLLHRSAMASANEPNQTNME